MKVIAPFVVSNATLLAVKSLPFPLKSLITDAVFSGLEPSKWNNKLVASSIIGVVFILYWANGKYLLSTKLIPFNMI